MKGEWRQYSVSDLIERGVLVIGDGYRAKNEERKRSAGLKRNLLHHEKLCFLGMKFASTARRGWRLLADLPRSVTY